MQEDTVIICQKCGGRNDPNASYCDNCGNRIDGVCLNCGHQNSFQAKHCNSCGQPLIGEKRETPLESVPTTTEFGNYLCPRCQHSNEPGSSYCYRCGLPLDDVALGSSSVSRTFQLGTPGGFWLRFLANFLDGILVTVLNLITYVLFGEDIQDSFDSEAPLGFADFVTTVLAFTYAPILISLWSTTVGKKTCGLYVVRVDGGRCGFWRAFGRELAKFISAVILFIGFLMIAFRKDKRGLHDLIAGTVVIER